MALRIIKFLLLWFSVAVTPSIILFFLLAFFYTPLNGYPTNLPRDSQYLFARGKLLEVESGHSLMVFEKSSTLWDTSKVAPIGSNLTLLNTDIQENFLPGETIIIKGARIGYLGQGQIDKVVVYKNHFQPWGVDWKEGLLIMFLVLTTVSILAFKSKMTKKH